MLEVSIDERAIRIGSRFAVSFQRTLRIPDDGRTYPLPPGLGVFPIHRVEDYKDRVPPEWREEGGAFIAMYQREALWLGFEGAVWKPNAVKVAIGRINAVSGQAHDSGLLESPQNYLVVPVQPWLDGINTGRASIRQFVAMPLGMGYTVEASLTDQEKHGGIQIIVFEPRPGKFPDAPPPELDLGPKKMAMPGLGGRPQSMGLGAGGEMRQKIYPDPYGIDVWDQQNYGRVTVHILNSAQYHDVTGKETPPTPIDAATYTKHNLPWFELYDEEKRDVAPSERLSEARTIAEHDADLGTTGDDQASFDVSETQIKKLRDDEIRPPDRK